MNNSKLNYQFSPYNLYLFQFNLYDSMKSLKHFCVNNFLTLFIFNVMYMWES